MKNFTFIIIMFFAFGLKAQSDLVINSFSIGSTDKYPGENFNATFTVKNQGNTTSVPTTVLVAQFTPPVGSVLYHIVERPSVPALAPGASQSYSISLSQGSNAYGPNYYVHVRVDYEQAVTETSETNNYQTIQYESWYLSYKEAVNYTSLSKTSNVYSTQYITASCRVTNISYTTRPYTQYVYYLLTYYPTYSSGSNFASAAVPYLAAKGGYTTVTKSIKVPRVTSNSPTGEFYVQFATNTSHTSSVQFTYACIGCREVLESELLETSADLFSVYPNPSSGLFNVDLGSEKFNKIEVYTLSGEQVLTQTIMDQSNDIQINMDKFADGQYILKLQGKDTQESLSILKQ